MQNNRKDMREILSYLFYFGGIYTPQYTHPRKNKFFSGFRVYKIHTITDLHTKVKDTHQSSECPLNPLFMRFVDYLKYLLRSPSNALP